ncbi:hypothetical protein IFR05_012398 [Cadophora sp. M221]|nr:hypothetical protein IFR05_012398 [Cadophora sp. M221]
MSTGQTMVYPWQISPPPLSTYTSQPVQVFAQQLQSQPRIIYQPQMQMQPQFQPQFQLQQQYQPYPTPQTYTAQQLIPGPGSGGTALPVPGGIPQSTRMEWRGGQWRPVVHYHFPTISTSIPISRAAAAYTPTPLQVAARPLGIPANQGYNHPHGVDLGPGPPGPPPVSMGGYRGVGFGGNVTSFLV